MVCFSCYHIVFDIFLIFVCANGYNPGTSYRNDVAFAAKHNNGTVTSWGSTSQGGSSPDSLENVIDIHSTQDTFIARHLNGNISVWGSALTEVDKFSNITSVATTLNAVACLHSNGNVSAFGTSNSGGQLPYNIINTIKLYSNEKAFCALHNDKTVSCWGDQNEGGKIPTSGLTDVQEIYSTSGAFAAIHSDLTVTAWGKDVKGGEIPPKLGTLTKIVTIFSTSSAFAALDINGNVYAWGDPQQGGNPPSTGLTNIKIIYSNQFAFAAISYDDINGENHVTTWGSNQKGGNTKNLKNVKAIYSTLSAFTAIKYDNTLFAWGSNNDGGSLPSGKDISHVERIFSCYSAFCALINDGSIVCYGDAQRGGASPPGLNNVTHIYSSGDAFAAVINNGSIVSWGKITGTSTDMVAPYGIMNVHTVYGQTLSHSLSNSPTDYIPLSSAPTSTPTSAPSLPTSTPSHAPIAGPSSIPTSKPSLVYQLDSSSLFELGAPWPSFRRSSLGHSTSLFKGPSDTSSTIRWTFTANGPIKSSPVVGYNEIIYFGSDDGYVYAVDMSGQEIWSYRTSGKVRAALAISNSLNVYAASIAGIDAINKETGALIWSKDISGGVKSSPTIDQLGNVYFGGENDKLYKISASGITVWTCSLSDTVGESSPALDTTKNIVIIGDGSGILYAASTISSDCNSFLWTYSTGGAIRSSPLIDDYGTVFVGSRDGYLHAVNITDGTLKWKTASSAGHHFDSSPAIDRHGILVYIADKHGMLMAMRARKFGGDSYNPGDVVWSQKVGNGDAIYSSPAIDIDGNLYISSTDGFVYAYNGYTGNNIWSINTGRSMFFVSPAIGGRGSIYVGNDDGTLLAIGPTTATNVCDNTSLAAINYNYTTVDMDLTCASVCPAGTGSNDVLMCVTCTIGTYSSSDDLNCLSCSSEKPFSPPGSIDVTQCRVSSFSPTSTPTNQPSSQPTLPTGQPSSQPSSQPSALPTSSMPTGRPTYIPTSAPSRSLNVGITFTSSQSISSTTLNFTQFLNSSSIESISFKNTLSNITNIPIEDITITNVLSSTRRRGLKSSRRLSTNTIEYVIDTNSHDMGLTDSDSPSTGEELYNHITKSLITSTQTSGSSSTSLFNQVLQYEVIQTASILGLNSTTILSQFADVTSDTVVISSTYITQLLRTPFPTSLPTSMPSCGSGSTDGINGCEPCPVGTYRSINMVHNSITCQECPIDTYADQRGLDECKICVFPEATVKKGSASCDAFSLRGNDTVIVGLFSAIFIILILSNYAAKGDRLASAIFSLTPSLDFISDLAYVTQVKFFNPLVFYLAVLSLFLSSFLFIHDLIKIRAYPRFMIPFPGRMVFSKVLWLSHSGASPLVDGHVHDFERHDNILKLFGYFIIWGFFITLQCLWLFVFSIWCTVHSIFWLPWLLIGLFLFQLKSMCVKKIYNLWINVWTLSLDFAKLDYLDIPVDASMMNESMLNEFLFESIPQLLLQGLNSTVTHQWDSVFAIFSFTFSLVMVINAVWRFTYYYFVEKIPIGDVPISFKIPGTHVKVELKRSDNDTEEAREKKLYTIHSQEHLTKLLKNALEDIFRDISNKIRHKRNLDAESLLTILYENKILNIRSLAKSPKAIQALYETSPNASLALKRLANNEDILNHLDEFEKKNRENDRHSRHNTNSGTGSFLDAFFSIN